jgi:HlyD family secretion protein
MPHTFGSTVALPALATRMLALGAISTLLLSACGAVTPAAVESKTADVSRGTLLATVSASGNVQPSEEVRLAFAGAGIVRKLSVTVGQRVNKGDVLAELDTAEADIALAKARLAVKNAETALVIAQTSYSRTVDGPRAADIASAQASVGEAQANYDKIAAGPKPGDYASADARLKNAEAALRRAKASYDEAYSSDPATITANPAALALEQATNDYAAAKAERDRASQPADKADLRAASQRIAQARANLDKVKQTARDYDVERALAEIGQAKLQIQQAQLDTQDAERRIKQAQLIAPLDAVVAAIDLKVGEAIGTNSALTLVDLSQLITDINVDEIDIARVKTGQDVSVRLDSLPGADLAGKITRIAPTSKLVNGVVTYAVRVSIPTGEAELRPGMTANTRIVLEKREGVLLLPNWAIRRDKTTGKTFVTLPAQGEGAQPQEVEVKLGLKDETNSEITGGLTEGQKVSEPLAAPAASN